MEYFYLFKFCILTISGCDIEKQADLMVRNALLIDSLQKGDDLKIPIFVMLSDNKKNFDIPFNKGKIY